MTERIRILIIEDSEDDTLLLMREIRRGGYNPEFLRVDERDGMKKALDESEWDIIISDYLMPNFSVADALEVLEAFGGDIPFIVVSGEIGEDIAIDLIKAGATDYVMKDNLSRLNLTVARELEKAGLRKQKRMAAKETKRLKEELEEIFNVSIPLRVVDSDFKVLRVNDSFCSYFQLAKEDVLGKQCYDVLGCEFHNTSKCSLPQI